MLSASESSGGLVGEPGLASASAVCLQDSTTKVGFIHTYGMKDAGPYLHGHVNTEDDKFTDTPLRLCKALEV